MKKFLVILGVIVVILIVWYFALGRGWAWEGEFGDIRGTYCGRGRYREAREKAQKLLSEGSEEQRRRVELLIRQIDVVATPPDNFDSLPISKDIIFNTRGSRQWHGAEERVVFVEIANVGKEPIQVSDEYIVAMAQDRCGFTDRVYGVGIEPMALNPGQMLTGPVVFRYPPANLGQPMTIVYIDMERFARAGVFAAGDIFKRDEEGAVKIEKIPPRLMPSKPKPKKSKKKPAPAAAGDAAAPK